MAKIVVENFLQPDENRYYFETDEEANQKATELFRIGKTVHLTCGPYPKPVDPPKHEEEDDSKPSGRNTTNFLQETREALVDFGIKECDIISVGNDKYRVIWVCFLHNSDFWYDSDYGMEEICTDLKIFGKNFVMYRCTYDGKEWWDADWLDRDIEPNYFPEKVSFKIKRFCHDSFSENFEDILLEEDDE